MWRVEQNAAAIPAADAIPVDPNPMLGYRIARVLLLPLLYVLFAWRIEHRGTFPKGPYIAIANHVSWLDAFAFHLVLPAKPRLHFLADPTTLIESKFQWFVVRKVGGYIPVDKHKHGDPTLFHQVYQAIDMGCAVGIFPEGHASWTESKLDPFKKGFAHFALHGNIPIVPIALIGVNDLWLRKKIRVIVGRPFLPDGMDVDQLTDFGWQRVRELLPEQYVLPKARIKLLRRFLTKLL
jgi:1-acyl-sn-glycerol-3-phosphate acyltransferase